jgi:hypothetical protein
VWQWRYLLVVQEFLESRRKPILAECCRAAKVHRTTAWRWFQDATLLRAYWRVWRAHIDVRDALVDYAVQTAAIDGNPRAWEANLRRRGEWDWSKEQGMEPGREGTVPPNVNVGVTFVACRGRPRRQKRSGCGRRPARRWWCGLMV